MTTGIINGVFVTDNLGRDYGSLIEQVLDVGEESSPRGQLIRELRPLQVTLNRPKKCVVKRPGMSRAFMFAEQLQLLAGEFDQAMLQRYSTRGASMLNHYGAYGPRIRDQLPEVVKELLHDPDSRRAMAYVCRPSDLVYATELNMPCIAEGTKVRPAGGLLGVTKRRYDGQAAKIHTVAGHELTVTPNHPILTGRGWISAGSIKKGDYVVSSAGPYLGAPRSPDVDKGPTRVEDLFEALLVMNGGYMLSAPGNAEDFHGDGKKGEIHVVPTHGLLRGKDDAPVGEKPLEQLFIRGPENAEPLPCKGSFEVAAIRSHSRHSGPCLFGALDHHDPRFSSPGELEPGGDAAKLDAIACQKALKTAEAIFPFQLRDGIPAKITANDLAPQNGEASSPALRAAGGELDEVVDVELFEYHGWVYNLLTESNWYWSANIITHNCTLGYQFFIRDGAVECITMMRSWDIVWGLSYDIPNAAQLQMVVAAALKKPLGPLTFVAGSGHIYEKHFGLQAGTTDYELPSLANRYGGILATVSDARLAFVTDQQNGLDRWYGMVPRQWTEPFNVFKRAMEKNAESNPPGQ